MNDINRRKIMDACDTIIEIIILEYDPLKGMERLYILEMLQIKDTFKIKGEGI